MGNETKTINKNVLLRYIPVKKNGKIVELLKKTAGIWKNKKLDPVLYLEKIRKEW